MFNTGRDKGQARNHYQNTSLAEELTNSTEKGTNKRLRNNSDRCVEYTSEGSKTSQTHQRVDVLNTDHESNTKQGTLSELAERLRNFHESANALTNCLQTRDTTRKTDQSMLETAKSMFSKFLEETNDDLDRALQPQEDQRDQATGNGSRSLWRHSK